MTLVRAAGLRSRNTAAAAPASPPYITLLRVRSMHRSILLSMLSFAVAVSADDIVCLMDLYTEDPVLSRERSLL